MKREGQVLELFALFQENFALLMNLLWNNIRLSELLLNVKYQGTQ